MMHCWTTVSSHTVVIASGRCFSPSQTAMHTSWTPRFFSSVSTCSQNFAPSPPSPAHSPKMVAFAAHRHAYDDVDRFVPDLPVADLHHQRVDEDDRIHRVERRLHHSFISSTTLSVILEIVSFDTEAPSPR